MENPEYEDIKKFGKNLATIRKSKHLSLEALANMAEVDMSGLHRIEAGKTNPKLSTVLALARALGINPKELFSEIN